MVLLHRDPKVKLGCKEFSVALPEPADIEDYPLGLLKRALWIKLEGGIVSPSNTPPDVLDKIKSGELTHISQLREGRKVDYTNEGFALFGRESCYAVTRYGENVFGKRYVGTGKPHLPHIAKTLIDRGLEEYLTVFAISEEGAGEEHSDEVFSARAEGPRYMDLVGSKINLVREGDRITLKAEKVEYTPKLSKYWSEVGKVEGAAHAVGVELNRGESPRYLENYVRVSGKPKLIDLDEDAIRITNGLNARKRVRILADRISSFRDCEYLGGGWDERNTQSFLEGYVRGLHNIPDEVELPVGQKKYVTTMLHAIEKQKPNV